MVAGVSAASERELLGPESEILAPELEALISDTIEKLDAAEHEARLSDDPIRVHLAALKGFLRSLRRLFVDGALKVAQEVREAQRPVRDEDLLRAFRQSVVGIAGDFIGQMRLQAYLAGAGLLLLAFLLGGVTGWVVKGPITVVAGLQAAAQQCQDYSDGSRLCRIPVWERLPPVHR